ncbi:hypothetical protein LP414_27955 [Polaromonas sp. P1(28)-13]|nr:hypothetical protein LP414_27955 [Polaromonas sp. P1(28)-13]
MSAGNIVQAHEQSQGIEVKVQAGNTAVTKIQSAAAQRIANQQGRINEEFSKQVARQLDKSSPDAPVCPAFELDVGTVRLLNAAREGAAVDSAGGGDETLNAPSGIGVSKLVDNDLTVVKLYKELATRHDELVDVVEKKLKDQAN